MGQYPIAGGEASVIIDDLIVGYHAWADDNHLVLFILGEPITLHYLQLPDKKDTVIASNIGRSLHRIPNQHAISFVHKVSDNEWFVKKLDLTKMTLTSIAPMLPGREGIAWTPNGILLSSDGTDIFQWKTDQWKKVTLPKTAIVMKGITRLAVNQQGTQLALVVSE